MGRLRHLRALAISAILLGLALLWPRGSRALAADVASRILHFRPAATHSRSNGPIPFILDLSRHKRHPSPPPATHPKPKRGQV